jgi:hypothetical protein
MKISSRGLGAAYWRLWSARVLAAIAFQGSAVAVGWQMYELTHSAFMLGLVGLAQYIPMVLLVLLVGHVADRYERRWTVNACQTLDAVAIAVLAITTFLHVATPALILTIAAVLGTARAFETPTAASLMVSLVPEGSVPIATSRWASANQAAVIVGPALGGVLLIVGPALPYVTSWICWSAAACLTLSTGRRALQAAPARKSRSGELFAGIHFIRRDRVLLGIMSLDLFAVLFGGATALLPIFATRILVAGPWALGALRSAPAIGALVTSLALSHRDASRFGGRALFAAVTAFGAATVLFGISRWLPLSLLALVLVGASDVVSVVIRLSLVQMRTPDELRGRVNAVNWLFIGTSNQLGEFESGSVAALLGPVGSVIFGGIGSIAVAGLWWLLFPELRHSAIEPSPTTVAIAETEQESADAL